MSNVTQYTADQLKGLNSTDLRKAGTELGIKSSSKYSKDELLQLCLVAIENSSSEASEVDDDEDEPIVQEEEVAKPTTVKSAPKVEKKEKKESKEKMKRAPRIEYATVSAKMQKIIDSDTKPSDKMKALFEAGMSIAQITKTLETHYSFVRGTIQRAAKADLYATFAGIYESFEKPKAKEVNKLAKAAIAENLAKYGEKFAPTIDDLEELVEKLATKIEDEEMLNAYVGQLDNPNWL